MATPEADEVSLHSAFPDGGDNEIPGTVRVPLVWHAPGDTVPEVDRTPVPTGRPIHESDMDQLDVTTAGTFIAPSQFRLAMGDPDLIASSQELAWTYVLPIVGRGNILRQWLKAYSNGVGSLSSLSKFARLPEETDEALMEYDLHFGGGAGQTGGVGGPTGTGEFGEQGPELGWGGNLPGLGGVNELGRPVQATGKRVGSVNSFSARMAWGNSKGFPGSLTNGEWLGHRFRPGYTDITWQGGEIVHTGEPVAMHNWYRVGIYVKLNDIDAEGLPVANGIHRIFVDGDMVFEETDVEWRVRDDVHINHIYWTMNRGGPPDNSSWWSKSPLLLSADNLEVTTYDPVSFEPRTFYVSDEVEIAVPMGNEVTYAGMWDGPELIDEVETYGNFVMAPGDYTARFTFEEEWDDWVEVDLSSEVYLWYGRYSDGKLHNDGSYFDFQLIDLEISTETAVEIEITWAAPQTNGWITALAQPRWDVGYDYDSDYTYYLHDNAAPVTGSTYTFRIGAAYDEEFTNNSWKGYEDAVAVGFDHVKIETGANTGTSPGITAIRYRTGNAEPTYAVYAEGQQAVYQPLTLKILDPDIRRAPTALTVQVSDAHPETDVIFSIDGDPVYAVRTDLNGDIRLTSIPVDEEHGAQGEHTLTATQENAKQGTGTFTLQLGPNLDPVAIGQDAQPIDVPGRTILVGSEPTYRWVLQDLLPGGLGSYILPLNPTEMTSPYVDNALKSSHTTSRVSGQWHVSQGGTIPREWQFKGELWDEEMYEKLLAFRRLNRRFYIIDHRNRAWKSIITDFQVDTHLQENFNGEQTDWGHDYTVTVLGLDQRPFEPV